MKYPCGTVWWWPKPFRFPIGTAVCFRCTQRRWDVGGCTKSALTHRTSLAYSDSLDITRVDLREARPSSHSVKPLAALQPTNHRFCIAPFTIVREEAPTVEFTIELEWATKVDVPFTVWWNSLEPPASRWASRRRIAIALPEETSCELTQRGPHRT
jgi:hypothetical protein